VMLATSQWARSEAIPSRLMFSSIALREMSNTVMFLYPCESRSSTNVDSPPPTSMMADSFVATCSISETEVSRCGRYQLTAVGAFSVYIFSQ